MYWSLCTINILTFLTLVNCSTYASDFFLSDSALFEKAQNGIGKCRIIPGCIGCACSMYAKVYVNIDWIGLPDLYGTGCLNGCFGPPNTYYTYQNTVTPVCTGSLVTNGANMIRIGIVKGFCDDPIQDSNSGTTNNSDSNTSSTNTSTINTTDTNTNTTDTNTNSSISNCSKEQNTINYNNDVESSMQIEHPKKDLDLKEILILSGFILFGMLNIVFGIYICKDKLRKRYQTRQPGQKYIVNQEKEVDISKQQIHQ